jgi:hypothetical protein
VRRISPRKRLLGGVLLLALGIWALDRFTGVGQPTPAQAGQQAPATGLPVTAEWQDVTELVARLTNTGYAPVASELRELDRDLFLPTAQIEEAFHRPVAEPPPEEPADKQAAEPPQDFGTRHRLVGVMLGPNPMAVIDGHVLPLDSQVDGHALIQVARDYVVFRETATGAQVTLELERHSIDH